MIMELRIERITAEYDSTIYSRLSELDKLCVGADGWSEESFRSECAKENGIVIGGFIGDKLTALVSGYTAEGEADITSVAVNPEYRRKGFAYQLIGVFESILPENTESIFLEVRESNFSAIGLYEKLGFEKLSVRKNFYVNPRENAVVMQKRLIDIT